jgi:hypothetical protein
MARRRCGETELRVHPPHCLTVEVVEQVAPGIDNGVCESGVHRLVGVQPRAPECTARRSERVDPGGLTREVETPLPWSRPKRILREASRACARVEPTADGVPKHRRAPRLGVPSWACWDAR